MKIKFGFIFITVLALGGCGDVDNLGPYSKRLCLGGVVYYKGYNILAPAFKQDGTLYTCRVREYEY